VVYAAGSDPRLLTPAALILAAVREPDLVARVRSRGLPGSAPDRIRLSCILETPFFVCPSCSHVPDPALATIVVAAGREFLAFHFSPSF
jgi:hypothetical protein